MNVVQVTYTAVVELDLDTWIEGVRADRALANALLAQLDDADGRTSTRAAFGYARTAPPAAEPRRPSYGPPRPLPARSGGRCGCACSSGGFCGGCGHAGCGGR